MKLYASAYVNKHGGSVVLLYEQGCHDHPIAIMDLCESDKLINELIRESTNAKPKEREAGEIKSTGWIE